MRFPLFSASPASLAGKGLLLLGCAAALSACNTTTDGKKTALITPSSPNATQQVAQANPQAANAAAQAAAPQGTAGRVVAVKGAQGAQAVPATAFAAGNAGTSAGAAVTAVMPSAQPALPGVQTGTQSAAALSEPVLPAVVPIPTPRGMPESVMAFAGAKAETSPGSLAAGMTFETPAHAPKDLDALITKYSVAYDVPERLVRRVVHRESRFNPAARNGPYLGLMQITHATARGMGYTGSARGLLNAETNLKYAVRYLSGAYRVAGGNETQAVRYYARGYYYDAKRKGLLEETGLDGSFRVGPTHSASAVLETVSLPTGSAAPLPGVSPIEASYVPSAQ